MRRHRVMVGILSLFAAASMADAASADDVKHFSFAYDQPHTTAYGVAGGFVVQGDLKRVGDDVAVGNHNSFLPRSH